MTDKEILIQMQDGLIKFKIALEEFIDFFYNQHKTAYPEDTPQFKAAAAFSGQMRTMIAYLRDRMEDQERALNSYQMMALMMANLERALQIVDRSISVVGEELAN